MTDDRGGVRRVSHPILRLEVIRSDGTRQSSYRVFCREQERAIPIGTCCACMHCEAIEASPAPVVRCLVSASKAEPAPDPLGLRTPIGAVIAHSAFAVTADTSVREAFRMLQSEQRRTAAVVDGENVVIGVIDEMHCGPAFGGDAADVMASRLALSALTPVRRAIGLMAAAHVREITIVDADGVPLGLLRDVDGLRWLAQAKKG